MEKDWGFVIIYIMNNILPDEAVRLIQSGESVVIDVRTPAEFADGHIPNAKNIDIKEATFDEKISELDRSTNYVINCQMGGRSARATAKMQELGFKNVKNLLGGIVAWKASSLPVEKNK